ncbi:hypothetical protein SDC9_208368 [bioreactor metagenome]|uniref:Uncharacterized protein n=1 Tax=bioreactor metagenome TaxID=1076179 RepID=A0A645JD94_9ZZZZ
MCRFRPRAIFRVAELARHIQHVICNGALEQLRLRTGAHRLRQLNPDIKPALRSLPAGFPCWKMLFHGALHQAGLALIADPQTLHMPFINPFTDCLSQKPGKQARRTKIVVALDPQHRSQNGLRQNAEPDPRTGRKGFAVGARIEHTVVLLRSQRR